MNKEPLCIRLSEKIRSKNFNVFSETFNRIFYDPKDGLNKIRIGKKTIPAILYGEQLGTQTFTKAREEATDTDVQSMGGLSFSTRTYTEAQVESTDEDPTNFLNFGTSTRTAVIMNEQTDKD